MALNPQQIANAVHYVTAQSTATNQMIAHPSRPAPGAALGADAPVDLSTLYRKQAGKLGPFLGAGSSFVADALAPQGKDQAPTNATQWLLNLLSTGTYASARFFGGLGQAVATADTTKHPEQLAKLNADPLRYETDNIGNAFAQSFGGAARGVAEGVGARFDGQKPRTIGQDFEKIGLTKAVEDAAGGLGATDTGGHFFDNKKTVGGILGTVGDVALDPLTYVGGVGLLGGAKDAIRAGADALRGGAGVGETLKAAGRAGVEGVASAQDAAAAAKASKAAAKVQRLNASRMLPNTLTPPAQSLLGEVTRTKLPPVPLEGGLAPELAAAHLSDVSSLLPKLTGTITREVPAGQILKDAALPLEAKLPHGSAAAISDVVHNTATVADVKPAIATLRKDPLIKPILAQTVTVAGKSMKVSDAIDAAVVRRLTGADPAEHVAAINQVLARASSAAHQTTPASLEAAVQGSLGDTGGTDINGLIQQLGAAKSMTERKSILQDALGTTQSGFKSFDDAMLSAVNGNVDVGTMREMLKALGIKSTISDPNAVRNVLGGLGAQKWEAIQAAVRTPVEVLTDHGVSPEVAAASQLADEVGAAQRASASYRAAVEHLGYDPAIVKPPRMNPDGTPNAGAGLGQAIHAGVERLGTIVKGKEQTSAYGVKMLREVHNGIVKTLRLRGAGATGAVRGENFIDDYLTATRAVEDYARSLGIMPRIPGGVGRTPLYVSLGQITSALPRKVLNGALFRPFKYRLGSTVGDEAFKAGLSIYPTSLAAGARAAVQALDGRMGAEDTFGLIRAALERDGARNAYQASAEGQAAVDEIARAMSDPTFQNGMKAFSDQQELIATKLSQQAAEGLVRPLATRITTAAISDGDRGALTHEIRSAYDDVRRLTESVDGGPNLVHELATQRLDNAMVNGILGEWGASLARYDSRALAGAGAIGGSGRRAATENIGHLLDDAEPQTMDAIQQAVDMGELEDFTTERLRTLAEFQMTLGQHGMFGKLAQAASKAGVAGEGSFGHATTFPLEMGARRGMNALASENHAIMSNWFHGSPNLPGVADRLGQELQLGRKATVNEVNASMGGWWRALGAYLKQNPDLPPGALHDALQRGQGINAKLGIHDATPPLSGPQADMAMELLTHINRVFQPNGGPLARSGLSAADVNPYLRRFGLGDYQLAEGLPLRDQTLAWADMAPESPLNLIMGFHNAMSKAAERPTFAAAAMKVFGHQAEGLTREQALAQGWRGIDPSEGSLAHFFDPKVLLHPDIRRELIYAQRMFDALDQSLPKFFSTLFQPLDAITGVLKPSMTIWRLGHHVTNILGNNGMLMLRGYNPLYNLRALGTLKQIAGTPAIDENGLSALDRAWNINVNDKVPGYTGPLKAAFHDQSAHVALKDGTVQTLTPELLASELQRMGIPMTAHQAKDLQPERDLGSVGGAWDRFTRSKLNVIAKANRALGNGSAWYENITRVSVAMQALESRQFKSMDEALAHAVGEVQKTHPTRDSLSAFDQKYTTRLILFHNWIRGALGTVLEAAIERPGLVTIPSKWQYNAAQANGLDPESIGKPLPTDPQLASYYEQGLLGPTWTGGNSPFGGIGDLAAGASPNLFGLSPSAPQIDALTNYFGGFNFGQDPLNAARIFAGNLNPLLAAPIELASDKPLGISTSKKISDNYGDWLWHQTGFPASVTDAFGLTGQKAAWTPEQVAGDQQRKLFNFVTGLKVTNYTNPTANTIATSEQSKTEIAQLQAMGYTKQQIAALRAYWKTQRATKP